MYIVGVLAFSEDVLGEVSEIRVALERLGYAVHMQQIGYQLEPSEVGMFEEGSLLFKLGRCYGHEERCRDIAESFVQEGVDLILAIKTTAAHAALAASSGSDIPIVFTHLADPVRDGLLVDMGRPGGSATGVRDIWDITAGERLALLQQVVPAPTVVHAFYNPDSSSSRLEAEGLSATADRIGVELRLHPARDGEEVQRELNHTNIHQDHALLRGADPLFDPLSSLLGAVAWENYIPYVGVHMDEMERCGALFTLDQRGRSSQAARLVDRILKGEAPGRIPVAEPERRTLGVNLQAAQDLGLVVAQGVLEQAQSVVAERARTTLGARLLLVLFGISFFLVVLVAVAAQYTLRTLIIAGVAGMVLGAVLLWLYLNGHMIRPIRRLTVAAEKIGAGNLDVDIGEARVEDELGVLGRTFRRMRSNLKYTRTQLERANASLEQQIVERTAAIAKLRETQQELEQAGRRIVEADDASRFLLTTYIHDELLVPLDELNKQARLSGNRRLSEVADQVDLNLRKVRYELSMPLIQDISLELRRLLQETLPQIYPEGRQVKLVLDLAGLNQAPQPGSPCSVLLYRFVRGAASNVFRHARAEHLWIRSAYDGRRLSLRVEDDGIGFDPSQVEQYIDQGHYFFHDVLIRARQLGGELVIESKPGQGACLEIVVPVISPDGSGKARSGTRSGGRGSKRVRR